VEQAVERLTGKLRLRINETPDASRLRELGEVLQSRPGRCPIDFEVAPAGRADLRAVVTPSPSWQVAPDRGLYERLCELLQEQNVVLVPRRPGNGNGRRHYASDRGRQTAVFARSGQAPG